MDVVTLLSGGLDSALVATLICEEGLRQLPVFIDYGQIARVRELAASQSIAQHLGLTEPVCVDISGYGLAIPSGLTDTSLRIREDAYLPGRNAMFLLIAAAHAARVGAHSVAVGHLSDATALFPDQTSEFRSAAAAFLTLAMGRPLDVVAPLATFTKAQVVALAADKGINGTWSCHAGGETPCGACIACLEYAIGGT